jgi:hypothetical protein
MPYRLIANQPGFVQIGGTTRKVEAGDRLHLSEQDGLRIVGSPLAFAFTVISSSEPDEPEYTELNFQEVVPELTPVRPASPDNKDVFATPVGDVLTNPLDEIYAEYAAEGNKLLSGVVTESEAILDPNAVDYDKVIEEALPENYNWRSIVAYLGKLKEEEPIQIELVAYIKQKFSGLTSVVKECDLILGVE